MPMLHHTFACAVCRRPVSLDKSLPAEVILDLMRDEFAVTGLAKVEAVTDGMSVYKHPLVCSDACHGKANRDGLDGYQIVDGNEARHEVSAMYLTGYAADDNDDGETENTYERKTRR